MIQRVKSASVTVDGQLVSSIGRGLLVLAAVSRDDTIKDVESMATKILKCKFWDDDSKDPPARVISVCPSKFYHMLITVSGRVASGILAARSCVVRINAT